MERERKRADWVFFFLFSFSFLFFFSFFFLFTPLNPSQGVLRIGESRELTKTFTSTELQQFGEISQDFNPLHFDAEFAKTTRFKRPILHGHLVTALFSGLLGGHLPGKGSVYLSQTFQYVAPVHVGEAVIARVQVQEIFHSRAIVTMETTIRKEDGTVCVKGEAKVMVPREYLPAKEN